MKKLLLPTLVALFMVGCGGDDDEKNSEELELLRLTIPDLSMEMLWCKLGTFKMGSPLSEADRRDDERQHTVILTQGFWLGKHEVTQAQWEKVMANNPSQWKGPALPVDKVSWEDAATFCEKLTQREKKAGRLPVGWAYVLPTESQWEYACRAATTTAFCHGNEIGELDKYAWNKQISKGKTHPVGKLRPNRWGFHDMYGNVWEWTADWYEAAYPTGSVTDPTGPASGSHRVIRGGSWYFLGADLRSARRKDISPDHRSAIGFRVCLQFIGE